MGHVEEDAAELGAELGGKPSEEFTKLACSEIHLCFQICIEVLPELTQAGLGPAEEAVLCGCNQRRRRNWWQRCLNKHGTHPPVLVAYLCLPTRSPPSLFGGLWRPCPTPWPRPSPHCHTPPALSAAPVPVHTQLIQKVTQKGPSLWLFDLPVQNLDTHAFEGRPWSVFAWLSAVFCTFCRCFVHNFLFFLSCFLIVSN